MKILKASLQDVFQKPKKHRICKSRRYLAQLSKRRLIQWYKRYFEKAVFRHLSKIVFKTMVKDTLKTSLQDAFQLFSRTSRSQSRFQCRNAKSIYHSIHSSVQNIECSSQSRRCPERSFKVTEVREDDNVLRTYDGNTFKSNSLLNSEMKTLDIVLYHDNFGIVNPL